MYSYYYYHTDTNLPCVGLPGGNQVCEKFKGPLLCMSRILMTMICYTLHRFRTCTSPYFGWGCAIPSGSYLSTSQLIKIFGFNYEYSVYLYAAGQRVDLYLNMVIDTYGSHFLHL